MAPINDAGKQISLAEAKEMTQNYRSSTSFRENGDQRAILFGKENIKKILNQEGCTSIRIYYGKKNETNDASLILIGVDDAGNNIIQDSNGQEAFILDFGMPCPKVCPDGNTAL